jgi:hypothetical protein
MDTLRGMLRVMVSLFVVGMLAWAALTTAPLQAQTLPTPTPDAEGAIYVEVQVNDSMWSIAARAGISLQTLWELNGLTETSIITPGDRLLVGRVEPAPTETPEPTLTPTLAPPTPTHTPLPLPQTAVCLAAFDDLNRDGAHDAAEPLRAAVAFTIFTDQAVVANYITDGLSEPRCLDLEPGTYRITRSIGRGETLTNDGDVAVLLNRGSVVRLAFGSHEGGVVGQTAVPGASDFASPQPAFIQATPVATAVEPPVSTQPDLLAWGVFSLTAVLVLGGLIFAIRARRQ